MFGHLAQSDFVKAQKASGKVTFLVYDDLEGKPLPELQHRIKVKLKTPWIQAFDHRGPASFGQEHLPQEIDRIQPQSLQQPLCAVFY